MDHTDAIVELKNIVDPQLVSKVVPLINKKAKHKLKLAEVVDTSIRNVNGYSLTFKLSSDMISQIELLKYDIGGKYEVHVDQYTGGPRHLSVIINLNDDYEGGDLIFTGQKNEEIKRLKLGKRSVVFFPSNFMYPHRIEPITKGTRYSIVAWLQ